jgi:hypothetical protein
MENRKQDILRRLHEEYMQREAERLERIALQSAWLTEVQHIKANKIFETGQSEVTKDNCFFISNSH